MKIFKRPRIEFLPEELAALKRAEEQINEYHSEQIDLMRQELNEIVNGGSGMKVKVKKCGSPRWWYYDKIGSVYKVEKRKEWEDLFVAIDGEHSGKALKTEDCEVIEEPMGAPSKNEFHSVQNPKHYHSKGLDPITVMKQTFSKEELRGFFRGNVLKYEMRYQEKGGVTDLEKAAFYLRELIELEKDSQ